MVARVPTRTLVLSSFVPRLSSELVFVLSSGLLFVVLAGLAIAIVLGHLAERRGAPEGWWGSAAIDTGLALTHLAIRHKIPLRLIAFLEDARSRHLLRTVGPVYQFRHATLQDRLAQPAQTRPAP